MIVVKNIDFLETDRDPVELLATTPTHMPIWCGEEPVQHDALIELIRGRRFRRPTDGVDIVVGVSKQAQDVIGIQYEAWDNLQKAYDAEQRNHQRTTSEMYGYKSRVDEMLNSSFWQRLKWLILGYR
jgi:hypothetical protein